MSDRLLRFADAPRPAWWWLRAMQRTMGEMAEAPIAQDAAVAAEWEPWAKRMDHVFEALAALGTKQKLRQAVARMNITEELRLSHALWLLYFRTGAFWSASWIGESRPVPEQLRQNVVGLERGVEKLGNPNRMNRVVARWDTNSRSAARIRVQTAIQILRRWDTTLLVWQGATPGEHSDGGAVVISGDWAESPVYIPAMGNTHQHGQSGRIQAVYRALDAFGSPQKIRLMQPRLFRYNQTRLHRGFEEIWGHTRTLAVAAYNFPTQSVAGRVMSLEASVLKLGDPSDPAWVQVTWATETLETLHAGIRAAIATLERWHAAL